MLAPGSPEPEMSRISTAAYPRAVLCAGVCPRLSSRDESIRTNRFRNGLIPNTSDEFSTEKALP